MSYLTCQATIAASAFKYFKLHNKDKDVEGAMQYVIYDNVFC